jgi:hypothetical protein
MSKNGKLLHVCNSIRLRTESTVAPSIEVR